MSIITDYLKNKYNLCSDEIIIYKLLYKLSDDYDRMLAGYILESSEISSELLTKCYNLSINGLFWGKYCDFWISKITSNPNCPKLVMNRAITRIKDRKKNVSLYDTITLCNILKSPNMDREMFRKIYENFELYNFDEKYCNEIFHLVYSNPILESTDLEKYYYIIDNRDAKVDGIDNIYKERMRYYHILSNPNCSKVVFDRLCKNMRIALICNSNYKDIYNIFSEFEAALNNPECPKSYLTEMVNAGFGRALFHPNFDENQKLDYDLFHDEYQSDFNTQFLVNLNYDRLKNLVFRCDYNLKKFVFSRLITSSELLEEIYDKIEDFEDFSFLGRNVLRWIFENPFASFDLRLKIACDFQYSDAYLIESSICSEDLLAKRWDDSEELRDLILHNPNCPINFLLDLLDEGYSAFFKKRQELMKLIINNNHFTSRILLDNWDYFIQEVGDDDFKNLLNRTIAYLLTRNSKDESLTDEDVRKLYMFYNRRIENVELILGRYQKEEELKAKLKVGINSFFGSKDYNNTANISRSTSSDVANENIVNKDNEKTQVVNEKLRLISELIPFYYGEKDLLDKACNLVDEYNRKVKQIHEEKKEIVLSFENDKNAQPSVSDLYSSLIDDLDSILKMLGECKIKYQKYEDILGYIDKIFKVLCSNQAWFDDLSNDIFLIKTKVLPFVDDDSFFEELKQIFESEKKYIVDYFKGNIDKLDYDSLNEFKVHIRNKLMIYLMRLDASIKDKYDINKIKLKFLNECLNIVADDREKYNMDWLKEIRGIINNIKLHGNDDEKSRLKEILKNVNYVDEHNIGPSLLLLFKNLYGLNLDIESRKSDLITVDRSVIKEVVSRQTK